MFESRETSRSGEHPIQIGSRAHEQGRRRAIEIVADTLQDLTDTIHAELAPHEVIIALSIIDQGALRFDYRGSCDGLPESWTWARLNPWIGFFTCIRLGTSSHQKIPLSYAEKLSLLWNGASVRVASETFRATRGAPGLIATCTIGTGFTSSKPPPLE